MKKTKMAFPKLINDILHTILIGFLVYLGGYWLLSNPKAYTWGMYQIILSGIILAFILIIITRYWHLFLAEFYWSWIDKSLVGAGLGIFGLFFYPSLSLFYLILFLQTAFLCLLIIIVKLVKSVVVLNESTTDLASIYEDTPIKTIYEDKLGRENFVLSLTEALIKGNYPNSFVISLEDEWGNGKSSIINMIRTFYDDENKCESNDDEKPETEELSRKIEEIKSYIKDNNVHFLSFDPWYYNSHETLLSQFFQLTLNKLLAITSQQKQKEYLIEHFTFFKQVQSPLSFMPSITFFGVKINLGFLFNKSKQNPIYTKEKIRETLLEISAFKFIIFIDDLDRLSHKELMLMFKLIRLCSDFPNFVFILAYDYEQVVRILKRKEIDKDFIDKIVQQRIILPQIEQENISKYIEEELNTEFNSYNIEISELNLSFLFIDNYKVIKNLREAKRFLNSIKFHLPLFINKVDIGDFLALEYLKLSHTEIYNILPLYKTAICNKDKEYDNDREEFKDLIDKSTNSTEIQHLLISLFPNLTRTFFPNKNSNLLNSNDVSAMMTNFRANRFKSSLKIDNPANFDVYFQYKLTSSNISIDVWKNIIKNWEKENYQFKSIYNRIKEKSDEFERAMSNHPDVLWDSGIEYEKFISAIIFPNDNSYLEIQDEIISLAIKRFRNKWRPPEGSNTNDLMHKFIKESPLPLVAHVFYRGAFLATENEKSIRILSDRFYKETVVEDSNVFEKFKENNNWFFILKMWDYTLNNLHSAKVNHDYIQTLLDAEPKLILFMVDELYEMSGEAMPNETIRKSLERIGVTNEVSNNAISNIPLEEITDIEKKSIDKLIEIFAEERFTE